ncbi:hypothetical protein SZN_07677 [Streptomyces zinciresistens K42]|uniref:Uncharacterized protein n=1 Tax=Streptomyces zinciresistens K42 TaxID=700597 RepID=G2G7S2_9ACTN|nr:hypothetical protein [Streptomyces zinciresistens]EGX60498.1 hypothetical protein SZN_07677 [Streptomyces zinciresistens K42]
MPEHVSILQLLGPIVLALAAVLWAKGLIRLLRRYRPVEPRRLPGAALPGAALPGLPEQRRTAPDREAVELTPAERDAFAGLVRRLGDR